jgi:hypothetical protein
MSLCCVKSKDQNRSESNPKSEKEKSGQKLISNPYLITASSPSNIGTNDLTSAHIVPSNEFKSEEQVIKPHGYVLIKEVAKGGFSAIFKSKKLSSSRP